MNGAGLRPSVVILAGLVIGLALGFAYTWFYLPAPREQIAASQLPAADKDRYRALAALAFAANGDRARTEARLQRLGEDRLSAVIDAQAQNAAQAGNPHEARALADLAAALRSPDTAGGATQSLPGIVTVTAAPTRRAVTATPPPAFLPFASPTTPVAAGLVFRLASSDAVCDPALPQGLLQVYVVDADGEQMPGVRVSVTAEGGQTDVFYTGLAADIGPGYADFLMSPQVRYTVTVGDAGEPAASILAPVCERPGADPYMGGIRTRFRP